MTGNRFFGGVSNSVCVCVSVSPKIYPVEAIEFHKAQIWDEFGDD